MTANKSFYSFEKTDVRWRFLLKFSTTNVKLETVCPIAANVLQIGEEAETDANLEHQPFGFTEQFIWNTKRLFCLCAVSGCGGLIK